ncbi:MAG: diaminopimelate epimerase [Crocinitomicaceae bacterium]|nr:diaminopimelate epimerase [Crocinitomicaceae bacterium]
MMEFYKYQGAGNDFVMIDNRNGEVELGKNLNTKIINRICNRNFGVGADGLILLQNDINSDFRMVYFNSDGNESTMCGNGGRCIVAFAKFLDVFEGNSCEFRAIDGMHKAKLYGDWVELQMIDVSKVEQIDNDFFLDTGSPHYVSFRENVKDLDLVKEGRKIRDNDRFKSEGTNVNFVASQHDILEVRTYERGVENETLACGTGVTAVALVADLQSKNTKQNASRIKAVGGELEVSYEKNANGEFTNIWLKGPAQQVFKGQM